MRRRVLAGLALLPMLAHARDAVADTIAWGLKGGLVAANIATAGPGAVDTASNAGGAVGVFLDLGRSAKIRFQPELLLTTRRFSSSDPAVPFRVSARSIEVPLLVHLRAPEAHRMHGVAYAGPQLSVIQKVRQTRPDGEADFSDQVKDLDVGATFGGGLEVAAGRGALLIEARFNLGFRQLSEPPDMSIKSRAFQALVGYRF